MQEPALGKDIGVAGRVGRAVAGVLGVAWVAWHIPLWPGPDIVQAARVAGYGLASLLAYTLLYLALGRFVPLANGWVAAFVLLGPLYSVFLFGIGPDTFHAGLGLYVSLSLIVNAIISYGGCEVVALPALWWRRRPVAYCPWNAVDAVERAAVDPRAQRGPVRWISIFVAVAIIAYFVVWDLGGLALVVGSGFFLADQVAWFLLWPVADLLYQATRAWRNSRRVTDPSVRIPAVAAVACLTMAFAFATGDTQWIWVIVMLLGLVGALVAPSMGHRHEREVVA